jgi:NAD(P)-dependent dehydrogenase (short-subunit alcohol dehydrogenase family)
MTAPSGDTADGATSRYAVVTGAAGGIGQVLAAEFERAGYRVIATDVLPRPDGLVCRRFMQVDVERTVADEAYAAEVLGEIATEVGERGLGVLINNAAVQILGGIDSLTRADWRRTLDVNLVAPFVWAQALLPALERARGCIINISSIHARLTKRHFVAYATSKAALSGMTRALAVDLGGRVRVNAIEPAAISTPMLEAGFIDHPDRFEQLRHAHPVGRIGTPVEVASLALALGDGHMGFVNGACVSLDGAIGARLHDPA